MVSTSAWHTAGRSIPGPGMLYIILGTYLVEHGSSLVGVPLHNLGTNHHVVSAMTLGQHTDRSFISATIYPTKPVSFEGDAVSSWSLLSGAYARGSKRSHAGGTFLILINCLHHSCVSQKMGCLENITKKHCKQLN